MARTGYAQAGYVQAGYVQAWAYRSFSDGYFLSATEVNALGTNNVPNHWEKKGLNLVFLVKLEGINPSRQAERLQLVKVVQNHFRRSVFSDGELNQIE